MQLQPTEITLMYTYHSPSKEVTPAHVPDEETEGKEGSKGGGGTCLPLILSSHAQS